MGLGRLVQALLGRLPGRQAGNSRARHGPAEPPARHLAYFELRDALDAPGCPVCRLAEEAVEAAQRSLLHENVNDPGVRAGLARSGGFCREHAWRLRQHRDLLGVAILHRDLVSRFRDGLAPNGPARSRCPACTERDETARAAIGILAQGFSDPEIRRRFEASDGLCRDHFEWARAAWGARPAGLEAAQAACLARLVGQLDELIRKHDYRFSDEPVGEEGDSALRGIAAVSGLDVAALPRPRSRKLPPDREGPRPGSLDAGGAGGDH